MTSEWNHFALGEITELVIDYRGKTPKKLGGDWCKQGYRALSAKNIKTGRIVQAETIRYIDESLYRKWMKDEVQRGDILITSEAPFGQIFFWDSDEKIVLSQRLFCVRIKPEYDARFIYYYMTTPEFQSELDGRATGTTVIGLRQPELMKCVIRCPEIQEQKVIAAILSSIDAKIIANEKVNDNLQQQAQALFKQWFVDNPDAISWKEGTFSNLIEKTISGDWGKDSPSGNNTEMVYCIRGADIPEVRAGNKGKMPTRYILPKNYAAKQLVDGDIVVEISGGSPTQSTGRAAAVSDALLARYDKGMVCTNFCKALKPRAGYSMYVYYYWQYLYDRDIFFSYENGTTGIKNLDINGFIETEPIVIAPEGLVKKFDAVCQTVFSKIYANGMENEHLALVRDTLLPKLMSGEIDASAVQL